MGQTPEPKLAKIVILPQLQGKVFIFVVSKLVVTCLAKVEKGPLKARSRYLTLSTSSRLSAIRSTPLWRCCSCLVFSSALAATTEGSPRVSSVEALEDKQVRGTHTQSLRKIGI